jgi:transposase
MLNDETWKRIELTLPGKEGDRGRTAVDNRRFMEAVLWVGSTGRPWCDLPPEFGRWHSVYVRFSRWRQKGVWKRVARTLAGAAEIEDVLIDLTIVRANRHSARALKNSVRQHPGVRGPR